MTALGDLTDVDLTGFASGDRLTYEGGLWKPRGWRTAEGTVTYPAGISNGWTLLQDTFSPAWAVTEVSSATTADAAPAAAKIGEVTVTADMVELGGLSGFGALPILTGLHLTLSFALALTTSRTIRTAVEVNGARIASSFTSNGFLANRQNAVNGWSLPVAAGDVIGFFAWWTASPGSDTAAVDGLAAAPGLVGIGPPTVDRAFHVVAGPSGEFALSFMAAPTGWEGTNVAALAATWLTSNIVRVEGGNYNTGFFGTSTTSGSHVGLSDHRLGSAHPVETASNNGTAGGKRVLNFSRFAAYKIFWQPVAWPPPIYAP